MLGTRTGGELVAKELSRDHRPDIKEEQSRIEKAGGMVQNRPQPARVRAGPGRRCGLTMSRSLGDGVFKIAGVIAEPEVRRLPF